MLASQLMAAELYQEAIRPASFSRRTSNGHLSQPVTVHQARVGQGTRKSARLAGRDAA